VMRVSLSAALSMPHHPTYLPGIPVAHPTS
jgi:hypothetical protein